MHSAPVMFLLLLAITDYSQSGDRILYQQMAVREPLDNNEQLRFLNQLVDKPGICQLNERLLNL